MATAQECCVLIPVSTLEDFPSDLSDRDACSLLAAWTVLWHPELIARSGQVPQWYRADAPPEPNLDAAPNPNVDSLDDHSTTHATDFAGRVIAVPSPSEAKLPPGYIDRAKAAGAKWISGANRDEMAAALGLEPVSDQTFGDQPHTERTIGVDDFYAAAYTSLQVQIMTRRLRYTSNLDQIHFESRLVAAATAFVEKRTQEAIEALHEVFDALAEERDHYFTSDPHLVDLMLVTGSTAASAIAQLANAPLHASESADESSVLPTPINALLDTSALEYFASQADETTTAVQSRLRDQDLGWAAGGPEKNLQFDTLSFADAAAAFTQSHELAVRCIGAAPRVYARLDGDTPSDLLGEVARLGYSGIIPINFAAGSGFGEEAKVTLPIPGGDIEALTAKPIDAASDSSFLTIGTKLGESIDNGEVSTGLLVHWPGRVCDSFRDLRRAASWCVALGRFWKIDEYFHLGERPYHQGDLSVTGPASADDFVARVTSQSVNPISSLADSFCKSVTSQRDQLFVAMNGLLANSLPSVSDSTSGATLDDAISSMVGIIGGVPSDSASSRLVLNCQSTPTRIDMDVPQKIANGKHIYGISKQSNRYHATIDIPAFGFAIANAEGSTASVTSHSSSNASSTEPASRDDLGFSPLRWARDKFLGKPSTIGERGRLHNEFMEVAISDQTGGVSGVYSGGVRGNRFSLRLVVCGYDATNKDSDASTMRCQSLEVLESSASRGVIRAQGVLEHESKTLANFVVTYTLRRGSRLLETEIELDNKIELGGNPWKRYIAARAAVSGDSAIPRCLIREKIHRVSSRRLVAPLGLVIDEAERKTLITSDGYPYHRVVGDRFFDTLIHVQGETQSKCSLAYGFDVPHPVEQAMSRIAPPIIRSVELKPSVESTGWFAHVAPSSVRISGMKSYSQPDGSLAVEVRLIQTVARQCQVKLRFFRDIQTGFLLRDSAIAMLNQWRNDRESLADETLVCEGGVCNVPMKSHGVTDVLILFASTTGPGSSAESPSPTDPNSVA
ncbi:hypothetical protein N9N28_03705 [Rubripirellula amarantea]|nr:hypothetical protein [Rubripirellula amarantea]